MKLSLNNLQGLIKSNSSNAVNIEDIEIGSILKARVLDISEGNIKLSLLNGEVLEGVLDDSVIDKSISNGDRLDFTVRGKAKDSLVLGFDDVKLHETKNVEDFVIRGKSEIMNKILDMNHLTRSDSNKEIVDCMISYKMPLIQEDIEVLGKNLDKLLSILNLKVDSGETLETLKDVEPLEVDINKLITSDIKDLKDKEVKAPPKILTREEIKLEKNNLFKEVSIEFLKNSGNKPCDDLDELDKPLVLDSDTSKHSLKETVETVDTIDTKLGKVTDVLMNSLLDEKSMSVTDDKFRDVTTIVKKVLDSNFSNDKKEDIIQKLVFLMKSDIDTSVKNLVRLNKFLENHETIDSELSHILNLASDEGIIDSDARDTLFDKIKTINLSLDKTDASKLESFQRQLKEVTEELVFKISEKKEYSKELAQSVRGLKGDIEFLNKINAQSTILLIPFSINQENLKNNLYVLGKKKIRDRSENIRVYMNLNTKNLHDIKILCDYSFDKLSVRFSIEEEFVKLFEAKKAELEFILNHSGYKNVSIYIDTEKRKKILDMLSHEETINYMLNIKV